MSLHDCHHNFHELATFVLPAYMEKMRSEIARPKSMGDFARPAVGVATLIKEFGIPKDFSGCYVLLEAGVPIYVGISRGVIGRLRQHVFGKTHFDASLAFRMARHGHNDKVFAKLNRGKAMQDEQFLKSFAEAQRKLRSLKVAYIEIANPLELYVFEAYCALELDTHQWNSFETH